MSLLALHMQYGLKMFSGVCFHHMEGEVQTPADTQISLSCGAVKCRHLG